jgi:hypothetical protein
MKAVENQAPEQRLSSDRRKKPTALFSKYALIGGRRKTTRRKEDMRKYHVLDSYDSWLWIKLMSIMTLSLVDAYLTILLIDMGLVKEGNPFMAFYLTYGQQYFIVVKVILTGVPLFFFCLAKDLKFTKISIYSAIVLFLGIVIYELAILYEFHQSPLFL